MSGFTRVDNRNMTDEEVCEFLCNSESFLYDSTDEIESDDENENLQIENSSEEKREVEARIQRASKIQLIDDTENGGNIDLDTSIHESFTEMINDENFGSEIEYGPPELNSLPYPPTSSGPSNLFSSLFSAIEVNPKSSEFERVLWKKGNLQFTEKQVSFKGDSSLPQGIKNLQTPYQVWCHLFPDDLEQHIVSESTKYSGINQINFEAADLRKFIGILFYMSYYKLPNSRDYWSENNNRCIDVIKKQMTRRRFEKIREILHFNDNDKKPSREDPNRDRLYLMRPVIEKLNKTFSTVPKLCRLCVDEQMCSTKVGSYMKQYLPNKPKKWGFKLFVVCDTMGYAYKFEIYSGSSEKCAEGEPDLQASANIVVRLLREVPRFENYIVYFDNFYTTIPLLVYLRTQGILAVGTIRRNRIKNCKLPDEKVMMKCERGTSQEFVCTINGIEVTSVSWKDNRIVNLVSTYIGTKPIKAIENSEEEPITIKRFDKKEKTTKNIPCPQIIKDYNCHMGGVALMDSSMGRHKIMMKSRKWTNRLFYHLLDMTSVNAWILYRRINNHRQAASMRLIDFKLEVADVLFSSSSAKSMQRGRPSLEKQIEMKRRKPNAQSAPHKDIRLDMMDHWTVMDKKGRCKLPNCSGQTRMFCSKCKVNLCLTAEKNCFYSYHHS